MNYIYCQLLNLIKEEYENYDILWELCPNKKDIENYIFNAEFTPNDVFEKDILEEWLQNNGWKKE
jgi:hypothetical protein